MLLAALPVGADPGESAKETLGSELARTLADLAGRPGAPLRIDPALSRAAEIHGRHIVLDPTRATLEDVQETLQSEGLADAWILPFTTLDPSPRVLVQAARAFAEAEARPRGLTHLGLARLPDRQGTRLVVLFSRRLISLQPLPRRARPGPLRVRGQATGPVEALWMGPCPTRAPCRKGVSRLSVARRGAQLTLELPLKAPGRYVLELSVTTDRGPEVSALWTVAVGVPPGPVAVAPERPGPNTAAALQALVDAARADAEVSPLAPDPALAQTAQAHAEAVCLAKRAAHVLGGKDPSARARAAGHEGPVSENVAIAPTVARAHHNFLLSPSHRINVLDPLAASLGIGVATRDESPGLAKAVCVVELYGR